MVGQVTGEAEEERLGKKLIKHHNMRSEKGSHSPKGYHWHTGLPVEGFYRKSSPFHLGPPAHHERLISHTFFRIRRKLSKMSPHQ